MTKNNNNNNKKRKKKKKIEKKNITYKGGLKIPVLKSFGKFMTGHRNAS